MSIGVHMVLLSLCQKCDVQPLCKCSGFTKGNVHWYSHGCTINGLSDAFAIYYGWSRCSPVGVVLIRAVLSGSRAAVVMALVAWWLWRPGLSGRGRMFELGRLLSSVVRLYLWFRWFRLCCGTQFRLSLWFRRFRLCHGT